MEICFADFAKVLQQALQPPNDDKAVVNHLLGWITDRKTVLDKKGNPINLSSSLISDLMNRKVDVPKAIKDECSVPKMLELAEEHFRNYIIPLFNPFTYNDSLQQIADAVFEDDSISKKTRENLNKCYKKEEYSEFLGFLLMYVISRSNKKTDENVDADDMPLLEETHLKCPFCNANLIKKGKQQSIRMYQVVNLYPTNATEYGEVFKGVVKPKQVNTYENKIVLCSDCANEYVQEPTMEMYQSLSAKKIQLTKNAKIQRDIDKLQLEDDIKEVILGLSQSSNLNASGELSLTALCLEQKISPDNQLLINDIRSRVLSCYNYIRYLFTNLDQKSSGTFEIIGLQVKQAYLMLKKANLPQDEIERRISEWIDAKSGTGNKRACHYVSAFFIQNCEVFDEISK